MNMGVQTPLFISLFSENKSVTNMSRGKRIEFQSLWSKLSFPAAHNSSSCCLPISLLDSLNWSCCKKDGKGKILGDPRNFGSCWLASLDN